MNVFPEKVDEYKSTGNPTLHNNFCLWNLCCFPHLQYWNTTSRDDRQLAFCLIKKDFFKIWKIFLRGGCNHVDPSAGFHDEGLVVAAVLLRLLRHKSHIRHVTHRLPVELTVCQTVVDTGLEKYCKKLLKTYKKFVKIVKNWKKLYKIVKNFKIFLKIVKFWKNVKDCKNF